MMNLFEELGITPEELVKQANNRPQIVGTMRGWVGEIKFREILEALRHRGVIDVIEQIPDQSKRKGDLEVEYRGCKVSIEVKTISKQPKRTTGTDLDGGTYYTGKVEIKSHSKQKQRLDNGDEVNTKLQPAGKFHVLAAMVNLGGGEWKIVYCLNNKLTRTTHPGKGEEDLTSEQMTYLLEKNQSVVIPAPPKSCWTNDLIEVLDEVIATDPKEIPFQGYFVE